MIAGHPRIRNRDVGYLTKALPTWRYISRSRPSTCGCLALRLASVATLCRTGPTG